MRDRLSWKRRVLVRSEILRLFFKKLTEDDRYSGHNRENFPKPIQMQLSKKRKTFSEVFVAFLKSTSSFEYSEEKDELHSLSISENRDSGRRGYLIVEKVLFQNTLWQ